MNTETAKYIINHFSSLMTNEEKLALMHATSTFKLESSAGNKAALRSAYLEKGWLTSDQSVLELLKDGYDSFELAVAKRIIEQNPDKVYFNNCPKCHKLARTPNARQCRHCGHNWH